MLEMDIERTHQDCGCGRFVEIGARYRRPVLNYSTGEAHIWEFAVAEVSKLTTALVFCRRVTLVGDDGRTCQPFVQDLFARYEAIDNVFAISRAPSPEPRERGINQ